ncbi:PREDICTED: serine/threonine-protein kinase ULK3-like [Priapulus caudatus]|uniref:Serine/threonine-protein kinase ULK3 n=1 Tax=Priapulus caudatus TaxID=37621 RepID=A0ABM1EU49_PRICU|nr:PREDICTED: serine/threonine-protein kinase ULK3-like [Priapulus caudatus]
MSTNVLPPPKVPGFVLTEKLGSGTYATVYKAYRVGQTREVVAIKCVRKSSLTKTSTDNLLTEIAILKKIEHEYIVKLKDFQWDDKHIFLIMEYCSGGDLSAFIKLSRCLSEKLAKRFLQQLAKALQFLRVKNIAHMDLKPQNILLKSRQDPILKLADFGFAQWLETSSVGESLRGSPLYMAPEMLLQHKYDASVDLWSVGVILFEALFGRAPYASKSWVELAEKIKDPSPIELPFGVEISAECRDLLIRLLQRDPHQRISYEDFFNHPFIDLEHMPSSDCLPKAIKLVTKAVKQDQQGEVEKAVKLYCQSLDYFVPAIQAEISKQKKDAIRMKVREYVNRAEELKCLLAPQGQSSTEVASNSQVPTRNELDELSVQSDKLAAALKVVDIAAYLDKHEKFEEALEKYEMALGAVLPLLTQHARGREVEVLRYFVEHWMRRAESIKTFLQLRKMEIQKGVMETSASVDAEALFARGTVSEDVDTTRVTTLVRRRDTVKERANTGRVDTVSREWTLESRHCQESGHCPGRMAHWPGEQRTLPGKWTLPGEVDTASESGSDTASESGHCQEICDTAARADTARESGQLSATEWTLPRRRGHLPGEWTLAQENAHSRRADTCQENGQCQAETEKDHCQATADTARRSGTRCQENATLPGEWALPVAEWTDSSVIDR